MTSQEEVPLSSSAYDMIWTQLQELQNKFSSTWWFFLLFPEQELGYGPKQMMFTFASKTGELIRVSTSEEKANNNWQSGMGYKRDIKEGVDEFWTTVVGWIYDGEKMHHEIVHQPSLASLNIKGNLTAVDPKTGYGGKLRKDLSRPNGIQVEFVGQDGSAKFMVYSVSDNYVDHPEVSDIRTKFGGTHLVAWRRFRFEGDFEYNNEIHSHHGLGYFQRVCMNIPMFPWKWVFIYFKDKSILSFFGGYIAPHIFRRKSRFARDRLENFYHPMQLSGYLHLENEKKLIKFDKVKITDKISKKRELTHLIIKAENLNGDVIKVKCKIHSHAQFLLDKKFFSEKLYSRHNYNEFILEVINLTGTVGDKELSIEKLGEGWGNHEYTWGFSV